MGMKDLNEPRAQILSFSTNHISHFLSFPSIFSGVKCGNRLFTILIRRHSISGHFIRYFTVIHRIYASVRCHLTRIVSYRKDNRVMVTRTRLKDHRRVGVTVSATRTRRVLIFRMTTITPAMRFSDRSILSQLCVFHSVRLYIIVHSLTMPSFLSIRPRMRYAMSSIRVSGSFASFPIIQGVRITTMKTSQIKFIRGHMSFLTLCREEIITVQVHSIYVGEDAMSMRFPVKEGQGFFPTKGVMIQFVRVSQALKQLFCPVRFPITIRRLMTQQIQTGPNFTMI